MLSSKTYNCIVYNDLTYNNKRKV